MLWIEPDELVYKGDNDDFHVRREQCMSIERVADAGSISAYFGNVHIILTFEEDGVGPRRVRLHPESSMTMTGIARASDRLAEELERWKGVAPARDPVKT
jgi:anthranilate/para-aminobenzoate synthase component II